MEQIFFFDIFLPKVVLACEIRFFLSRQTLCNLCTRAYLSIFKVASSQQLISFAGERMSMTREPKCVSSNSGWAKIRKKGTIINVCSTSGWTLTSKAKINVYWKNFIHSAGPACQGHSVGILFLTKLILAFEANILHLQFPEFYFFSNFSSLCLAIETSSSTSSILFRMTNQI